MTERTRTQLKALYENGDTLLQTSFVDLIDSQLNLVDTTAQSFSSNLKAPQIEVSGNLSAGSTYTDNITILSANTTNLICQSVCAESIRASSVRSRPPWGAIYCVPQQTVMAVASSEDGVIMSANTTAIAADLVDFSASPNRLTYTGTVSATFNIDFGVRAFISLANTQGRNHIRIHKTGTRIQKSTIAVTLENTQWDNYYHSFMTDLKQNDYLEIFFSQTATSTCNLTVGGYHIVAFPVHWK